MVGVEVQIGFTAIVGITIAVCITLGANRLTTPVNTAGAAVGIGAGCSTCATMALITSQVDLASGCCDLVAIGKMHSAGRQGTLASLARLVGIGEGADFCTDPTMIKRNQRLLTPISHIAVAITIKTVASGHT